MRPVKLREHQEKLHPDSAKEGLDALKQKKARFHASGTLPKLGFSATQKPTLEASYKVAYLIAKDKKPHTIGETLVKPCALEMVELVCGKQHRKEIENIPLSNNVIQSRIHDMSLDLTQQVLTELKASPHPYSMQLDETTDVAQCSQLLVFVRYVHSGSIKEEFLFCRPLLTTTKAQDVLAIINDFFAQHDFDEWKKKLGSICTDGAPAMLGNKSGLTSLIKAEAPQVTVTHCILHRHALASKTLPNGLKLFMTTAVQVVNFIRARATNHRLFKVLCQDIGSIHEVLLYHTEVRWLSRGQVFSRLIELQVEVAMFLREKESDLAGKFDEPNFIFALAYLADIFSHLNDLNISIQGPNKTILDASEKLKSFLEKLPLWTRRVESNNFANFTRLEEALLGHQGLPAASKDDILTHLTTLRMSFQNYFGSEELQRDTWIRNPFLVDLDSIPDEDMTKDDLIDLRHRELIKSEFCTKDLAEFWCSMMEGYPALAKRALQSILPFVTTYLCEAGFSTLLTIKTKSRNRLEAEDDMRVALSKSSPRFDLLVAAKQQHPSH